MKLILEVDNVTLQRARDYVARVQRSAALRQHLVGRPATAPVILGALLERSLNSTQQQTLEALDEIRAILKEG